jgi:hypothetical protein
VGETDAWAARLQQHRLKEGKVASASGGQQQWGWADAACLAAPARDKSAARAAEAGLIRALARAGVPLLSESDGQHRNFGAGPFSR